MRVPPAQPGGQEVKLLLRSPGIGVAQRLGDAGDARVEDEAVNVRELGAERARQAQVEEAVQAHRAADVEQQHRGAGGRGGARFHARRSGMPPLATLRRIVAWQVEPAAALRARFAAQLQALEPTREAAHQRLDVAHVRGPVEVAEVRRSRATPRGSRRGARRAGRRRSPHALAGDARRRPASRSCASADGSRSSLASGIAGDEDSLGSAAGNRRRTSASKRRHSSPRPHSSACRLQRRTSLVEHADAQRRCRARRRESRAAGRRSRWREESSANPASRALQARRPGRTRPKRRRSACGGDPGDDLAREPGAVLARLDQRAQRLEDALGAVVVERRDAQAQQRRRPVERLGDARLLAADPCVARSARTRPIWRAELVGGLRRPDAR